jgi:hypothetical protein
MTSCLCSCQMPRCDRIKAYTMRVGLLNLPGVAYGEQVLRGTSWLFLFFPMHDCLLFTCWCMYWQCRRGDQFDISRCRFACFHVRSRGARWKLPGLLISRKTALK